MTTSYDIWLIILSLLALGCAILVAFRAGISSRQGHTDIGHVGYKDALTKLPNRHAFQYQLEAAAKRCTRAGNTIALAYIDLDHFKPINDNFGHHVGDIILLSLIHI